jgi:hypothetical protein
MNEIKSLLAVGDGRGFVVEDSTHGRRYVITAAHCLPRLPTGFSIGDTHERTYVNLLGPLGGERAVSAECLFVDPVADIAVLGSPDGQIRYEEARAYEALTEDLDALQVATKLDAFIEKKAPPTIRGWLISLDGTLQPCRLLHMPFGPWWTEGAVSVGGMSGSPILAEDGKTALGVVCAGTENEHGPDGPHARLATHLPGWLLYVLG